MIIIESHLSIEVHFNQVHHWLILFKNHQTNIIYQLLRIFLTKIFINSAILRILTRIILTRFIINVIYEISSSRVTLTRFIIVSQLD